MTDTSNTLALPSNIMQQGEFDFWTVTAKGIRFKKDTPRDEWLKAVEAITGMQQGMHQAHEKLLFMLGDALSYGEREYGEEYAQAIDATRDYLHISMKRLQNAAAVASSIDFSRRRENLTFGHHEVVAKLPPDKQDAMLAKAEAESLTVAKLAREVALDEITPKERKQIEAKLSDSRSFDDLTAAQIRKSAKHIRDGTPEPQRKAVINIDSEEELQLALNKIADWFDAYQGSDLAKSEPMGDWPQSRKDAWGRIKSLVTAARRMGLVK